MPGTSRGLHCDQAAPRQKNAPMVRNPGNSVMSPHAGISGHKSYNDNSGKKKGRLEGGKQKTEKSTNPENNPLKKGQRQHNTLPNMFPNSH